MGLPGRTSFSVADSGTEVGSLGASDHPPSTRSPQVASLYRKQSQIQNQQGADLDSDSEDFY